MAQEEKHDLYRNYVHHDHARYYLRKLSGMKITIYDK
jgi:hypothetical protein